MASLNSFLLCRGSKTTTWSPSVAVSVCKLLECSLPHKKMGPFALQILLFVDWIFFQLRRLNGIIFFFMRQSHLEMTSPLTRVSLGCHSRSPGISFCVPDSPWQLSRYTAQTPKSDFHSYLVRSAFLESSADFLGRLYIQSRTSQTGGGRRPYLPSHHVFNKYLGSPTLCLTPSGVKGTLRQMTGPTVAHQKGNKQGTQIKQNNKLGFVVWKEWHEVP